MQSSQSKTSGGIRQRARDLRGKMTPAEKFLWERLRNRRLAGLKFRRQHPIGPYIVDFYCAECRLVIEVDRGIHLAQAEEDEQREQRLFDYGYRMLRFHNDEILGDLEGVSGRILDACQVEADTPLPASGEGQELALSAVEVVRAKSSIPGAGDVQQVGCVQYINA